MIVTLKLASLQGLQNYKNKQRKGFRTPRRNGKIIRYESSTNQKSVEKNMEEKTLKIYYDKAVRLLQGVCI